MLIKTRMILCYGKFWPSDLRVVAEDAVGEQVLLDAEQFTTRNSGWTESMLSIRPAFWYYAFIRSGNTYSTVH